MTFASTSGLMIGKEGPMVHLSCSIAHLICKKFKKFQDNISLKNEIYAGSVAAGFAVAFKSPIGGIIFALEDFVSYHTGKVIWIPFIMALLTLNSVSLIDSNFNSTKTISKAGYQKFDISLDSFNISEVVVFALIGAFGAMFGLLHPKCLLIIGNIPSYFTK
ncbi:MAG: H(+)/Cl(-) exchange transporter 4 [Paramarteilia canceri]